MEKERKESTGRKEKESQVVNLIIVIEVKEGIAQGHTHTQQQQHCKSSIHVSCITTYWLVITSTDKLVQDQKIKQQDQRPRLNADPHT